jgi:hypothetical protein
MSGDEFKDLAITINAIVREHTFTRGILLTEMRLRELHMEAFKAGAEQALKKLREAVA